jgi:hypothetical protein
VCGCVRKERAADFEAGRGPHSCAAAAADLHRGLRNGATCVALGEGAPGKCGHAYWPAPLKTAGFAVRRWWGVGRAAC